LIALALVTALAVALRFGRLYWGLDRDLWFADETMWILRMRPFDELSWKSFDTLKFTYPTLYQFTGGLVAHALGWAPRGAEAIAWMRTVAATASVLAVVVTALLGAATYGPWVGVVAAAFLAVAPFDAMQVHYANVEPFLVLCTTLVMAASWRLARRGTLSDAFVAGVTVGLATASKYPGLALASVVLWAIAELAWRERSARAAFRRGAVAAIGAVLAFALACPPCVVHADLLAHELYFLRQLAAFAGYEAACLVPQLGWWHRPWLYEIVASLPYGLGLPLAVLAMAGVVLALRRWTQADRLLLATLVPYFAYMGASSVVYPRYMLPLFPGLALVAAAALGHTARRRVATVLAVAGVAYGLALTTSQLRRFSWDQQSAVADWLGDHASALAPSDLDVSIPGSQPADPYFRLRAPLLAKGFRVGLEHDRVWLMTRPAFFVLPEWQSMSILRDRRDFLRMARMTQIQNGGAGYRPVMRVPIPGYLQGAWDARWDPTFAVELWQGSIGFTVYARKDVLPELQTVDVLESLPAARPDVAPVAAFPSTSVHGAVGSGP
jgi:4-amino-4-deoxy-L-arabinose transferase-like glycosyltransferase